MLSLNRRSFSSIIFAPAARDAPGETGQLTDHRPTRHDALLPTGRPMRHLTFACMLTALCAIAPPLSAGRPQATPAAPTAEQSPYLFEEVMVPMRDGARMQTVIMRPRNQSGPLPILFQRTPYGVPGGAPKSVPRSWAALDKDGYIFVFQSMRGRFKSDGVFTLSTAVHPNDPKAVDEATDAFDSIAWLVKHVPQNSGKVGMW
eukprot:gene39930-53997_t